MAKLLIVTCDETDVRGGDKTLSKVVVRNAALKGMNLKTADSHDHVLIVVGKVTTSADAELVIGHAISLELGASGIIPARLSFVLLSGYLDQSYQIAFKRIMEILVAMSGQYAQPWHEAVKNGLIEVSVDYSLGSANTTLATVWAATNFTSDLFTQTAGGPITTIGSATKLMTKTTSSPRPMAITFITIHDRLSDINRLLEELHYTTAWRRVIELKGITGSHVVTQVNNIYLPQWEHLSRCLSKWDNFEIDGPDGAYAKICELREFRNTNVTIFHRAPSVETRLSIMQERLAKLSNSPYQKAIRKRNEITRSMRIELSTLIPAMTIGPVANRGSAERDAKDLISNFAGRWGGMQRMQQQAVNEYKEELTARNLTGYEQVIELVRQAIRRGEAGLFSDAVFRLLTALELIGRVRLLLTYGKFSESLHKIEESRISKTIYGGTFTPNWDDNSDPTAYSHKRSAMYKILKRRHNDDVADIYFHHESTIKKIVERRNQYVHSEGAVHQSDYDSLLPIIQEMLQVVLPHDTDYTIPVVYMALNFNRPEGLSTVGHLG